MEVKMFNNYKVFKTEISGRKLVVETGKYAQLANGSCLIRYGETVLNVAVTASSIPREGIDFFPLSVDFEEKLYSVGKIPGSFSKREGKPSEKAVLSSRVIDRPIRPLFPKEMRNDVSVVCTVLSVDEDCSPEITAMIGTSIALSISDIPWSGPISGVSVGYIDEKMVINPTEGQSKESKLSLTVASSKEKVVMIEAAADRLSDDIMYEAIMFGHKSNQKIIDFINIIKKEIGKEKFEFKRDIFDTDIYDKIENILIDDIKSALYVNDKSEREKRSKPLYEKAHAQLDHVYPDSISGIDECIYKLQKKVVRKWLIEDQKRVDGRKMDEMRSLYAEVGILPRAHGSGMFTRGQTQVITVATLGPISDQQTLDGIDSDICKRYMHHYNFPSYSVGETRPNRGPGRREIGHGALAEKALIPVLPSEDEFPYAIRLVSEVLSSNGSTSQASVCGSTLALMDAGVPIKDPVAGISCGLITEGDKWLTMVDIQGLEDFFGDMDFKVAGTFDGITAIQMDLKIDGLTSEIIKESLHKTHIARNHILNEVMAKCINKPRSELSKYAPKVLNTKISLDKIREVIGSGGKVVQKLSLDYEVKIDIHDDGRIFVMGLDVDKCKKVIEIINNIDKDLEVGTIYKGKVTRIMNFGAFVEIVPGKEGLCHISQLDNKRVEKVTDVLNLGDEILVKVVEIDSKGRINLSMKNIM
jgi:polyribonucleotide nucleotidyltransferase